MGKRRGRGEDLKRNIIKDKSTKKNTRLE